eukprot:TRINITY_DN1466_c0_g1_i11.p1 TRINITY_DN1466_c0_g1~~TRINITY_DN1466_c0_g1_i11.p1  ORF type:complete len:495 (+),score=145.53 TRINITY_DN1466_c0_g1_i11:145-1629(+)
MQNLLVPFRTAAKVTFEKLVPDKLPTGSNTLAVVLDDASAKSKGSSPSWLKPYLKEEMMKDVKTGKIVWLYPEDSGVTRLALVPAIDKSAAIKAAAKNFVHQAKARSVKNLVIAFCSFTADEVGKFLNVMLIENIDHTKKGSGEDKCVEAVSVHLKEEVHGKLKEVKYWVELAKGVILAKNVVNQSPSLATPDWVEEQAKELFKSADKVKITSIVGKELAEKNYGCIYAVGSGAVSPPRLVTIHYTGSPSNPAVELALVGKGVTFDSGGLNLKSTGSMETMNLDKSGACNVLAAMHCISELKLPINVVGCLALAENIIGKECYKPSDILTSFSGKTVEVANTDAEGRLCLIDALTHVQRNYKPKVVIDIATLTGACLVALGLSTGGLFTNDDKLAESLLKCSSHVDESFWQLPVFPEHGKAMKGSVADLTNSGSRYAGASTAAAFLKEFIEGDTKWAHLDIVGPAIHTYGGSVLGLGTGFGMQTMVNFAKSLTK